MPLTIQVQGTNGPPVDTVAAGNRTAKLLERAAVVAVRAAEDAGHLVRTGAGRGTRVRAKGANDVVTQLDLDAETLIVNRLRSAFPTHRIISEEAGLVGSHSGPYTWLVDPLDGSNNLAIGLPAFVVGIALCRNRAPVLGVIHDPNRHLTWSATAHGGVRHRGSTPDFGPRDAERGLVVAWTQGHGLQGAAAMEANRLKSLLETASQRVLQLWAPLLCWSLLADGNIDALVGYHAEGVDLPAGTLIAREAGVAIRDFAGREFDDRIGGAPPERTFVAARPDRIQDVLRVVSQS